MSPTDVGIFFGRPVRSQILADKLRARGLHVTLYNNRGLPGTYIPVPLAIRPALSQLFSTHHQVYLTSLDYIPSMGLYLNWLIRGYPYVFNAIGLKSAEYRDRARRWLYPRLAAEWLFPALTERVLRGARRIVCNSQYLRTQLIRAFPAYAPKMVTVYNGIEFDRFSSGQRTLIPGLSPHSPKIITVMTWNYEGKAAGATLLIDAMGSITAQYPKACLMMAAKTGHAHHARAIEHYLESKPWKHSIHVLYNQTNIPALLASSDLFVYATPPNSSDSLPRVLLEAHAAGLPIVATATAGCPEVVEHQHTGFLVPYHAEALAERVIELLRDPGRRQEMGECGRARVSALFDWEQMAEAYASLLLQVAAEPGAVAGSGHIAPST